MNRRLVATLILLVWLAAIAALLRRQLGQAAQTRLADAPLNVSPTATYYRVALGNQVVGFASNAVDTLPDTVRVEDLMVLDVPTLDTKQHVEARSVALLTRTLHLRSFTTDVRGSRNRFAARGTVSGDTLLTLEIESAGTRQTLSVPLPNPIILPTLVPLRLAFERGLRVGQSFTLPLFDPLLLQERAIRATVTAESTLMVVDSASIGPDSVWVPARWDTVRAWRVTQSGGDITQDAWIDDLGRLVSATTPVGFRLERTAFEIAYANFRRSPSAAGRPSGGRDLIRETAIAGAGADGVPLDTARLAQFAVRLLGVDLTGSDLSGGRQRLVGDTLIVTREIESSLRAAYRLPATAPEMKNALRDEPLIQVSDPRIEAQARTIIGRQRNPVRAAELLNRWVHDELNKRVTVSLPSALEVLQTRRGDCNEHTVLFVALARAVGLPARTAAGLVYLHGRFYYHAWPEVWTGREWLAVDPTLGQFPADAAHLRFAVGGLARQLELLRLIGQLTLDVVETKPTS